ncbi:MAG: UDP-N-acetylglucosamine 2-epimerase [Bacillota bacterium]|nr:UDP-N-acetylglucosamine 2-epimerase [Bacillota bacterium]
MKTICFTGTRADYGIYRPLLKMLSLEEDINLQLVVTGMHLLEEYGRTITAVQKDGLDIIAAPSILIRGDGTYHMSQSVGLAVLYFADILDFHRPDFILLLGDRGEMLAAALAAHYQNIGIVHLFGGESSGSADDAIRHAVSKLAHLHFVSTLRSKANLVRMGEDEWRITAVGTLRKHDIVKVSKLPPEVASTWLKKYKLSSRTKNILVCMHPDSKEELELAGQIGSVIDALDGLNNANIIIIGPNSDAGADLFRERLLQFSSQGDNRTYLASIDSDEYLFLLSRVDLMVGNSSSGIIETPFFNIPFINVGRRQQGRECGSNVLSLPYHSGLIKEAIVDLLQNPREKLTLNPYDLVDSPALSIVEKLKEMAVAKNWCYK